LLKLNPALRSFPCAGFFVENRDVSTTGAFALMTEKINIMIIEDNPGDARLVREALAEAPDISYHVLHADRLATGLQLLKEQPVEVLLLDLGLPDSQGIDTVVTAHTRFPDLPIVVLSGIHDETTALDALKHGAQDYLPKGTILGAVLPRVLRYAIERQRLRLELTTSEARIRRIIEENPDGVVVVDHEGIIRFANPASQVLFGVPEDVLLGTPLGLPNVTGASAEITIPRKGQSHITAEMRSVTSIWDGAPSHIVSMHDITARKLAETRIETQMQRIDALHRIDSTIAGCFDLRMILNVVLDQATTLLGMDAACIMLLDPAGLDLEVAASKGFRTPMAKIPRIRLGEGFAGRAALERISIMTIDPERIAEHPPFAALWTTEGFADYACVPLIVKGVVKGVMEVFHRTAYVHDEEWRSFLDALAGQAAIANDNIQLFKHLQHSNMELTLAYDSTIEGWSRAMDLRDRDTEGHTLRVAGVAEKLAQALGIGSMELLHIRRGSLLHDIGKIGVPDNILLKPGPLTPEEWEIMRRHPQYAYDMLSSISYLHQALDIPWCHHEKWDGSGYPRGLNGDRIPVAARIFAVVDVWDALRSDRPYRQGWPEERVREYLRAESGIQFDPGVVEKFLQLLR
jgi:putative nucleotidyltransferase with HDIG domain